MSRSKYVASEMLLEAANRHQIHLSILVAETGLWANAKVHGGSSERQAVRQWCRSVAARELLRARNVAK